MAKQKILIPSTLIWSLYLYILLPWIDYNDSHFLMFNFEMHKIEFLFFEIEASTHQIIYVLMTVFIGLLLGLNLTLSRFFCGYFCPSSLATFIQQKFKNPIIMFLALFGFSFLIAFSTIAYFTPALKLLWEIFIFDMASIMVWILTTMLTTLFLLLRSWYCSILCPYFFIGAILPQDNKQTYTFINQESCIECNKCVVVCPIEDLDIKKGFDLRCVQCGLCEDACGDVMKKYAKPSLIQKLDPNKKLYQSFSQYGAWYALILFICVALTIFYILDNNFLDFCYFENKHLYQESK